MSLELAWAAGFFDGEGSTTNLTIYGKYKYLSMSISQIDSKVLDRFKNAVGLGKVYGPYDSRAENSRPTWRYIITGNDKVIKAITQLWPFLSEIKKDQAVNAFDSLGLSFL